ncbi:MAG: hypothetical protein IT244_10240 [Bacteroidia bacterium]|nr:hypothetical protein [Bacteroidia bacterium]
MPENKFNNEIKQAMESFDIPMVPVDTAYDLFLNKKKKKRGFIWWFMGTMAILLVASGIAYSVFNTPNGSIKMGQKQPIQNNNTVLPAIAPIPTDTVFANEQPTSITSTTGSAKPRQFTPAVGAPNFASAVTSTIPAVNNPTEIIQNPAEINSAEAVVSAPILQAETANSTVAPQYFNSIYSLKIGAFPIPYFIDQRNLKAPNRNASIMSPNNYRNKYFMLFAVNDPFNIYPGAFYRKMNFNVGVERQLSANTFFYLKGGLNAFNLRRQYINVYDTINGDYYHDSIHFHTLRQLGIGMGFVGKISKRSRLGFGFTYAWNMNIKGTNYQTIYKSTGNSEIVNKPYTLDRSYFRNLNLNTRGLNLNIFYLAAINRKFDFTIESNFGFTTINNNLLNNGVDRVSLVSTPRALFFGLKYNF